MSARRDLAFRGADGVRWTVRVQLPGASNAMVVFQHPDPLARSDRYAWWLNAGPEARDVTARLDTKAVLAGLDDGVLRGLFARSMPVHSTTPRFEPG